MRGFFHNKGSISPKNPKHNRNHRPGLKEYNELVLEKIKNLPALVVNFVKKYQLNDVRNIGLLIFGVMAATVTWNGAKAIELNFTLQKQVEVLQAQNKVLALQNDTQALKNEYYKTDEYKELAARRLFGKAAPGEQVYVIPKEVAFKYVAPKNSTESEAAPVEQSPVKLPTYQQNVQDWLDFFFHRGPSV